VDLGRTGQVLIFTSSEIEKEIEKKLKTKFGLSNEDAAQVLLDFSTFTVPVKVSRKIWIFDIGPSSNNKSRYNVGYEAADAAYNVFRIRVMG
jgi:hypothetical protein